MARRVEVKLVDDLDGGRAEETVAFALDGVAFEIDLSQKNAAELRSLAADFVANARRAGRGGAATQRRGTAVGGQVGKVRNRAIRAWAKDNRIELAERGRIPVTIVEQFDVAQPGKAQPSTSRPPAAQPADAIADNPPPAARTGRRTAKKTAPTTNLFSAAG